MPVGSSTQFLNRLLLDFALAAVEAARAAVMGLLSSFGSSTEPDFTSIAPVYGRTLAIALLLAGVFIPCAFVERLLGGPLGAGWAVIPRTVFAMAAGRDLPPALAAVHQRTRVPHLALIVVGVFVTGAVMISEIAGLTPVDILGYYGSIATYGFIVAYLIISLAALGFLHRRGELRPIHFVPALVGAVAMGAVLYYSVIPVPAYPYNIFPYVFLGLLVPGLTAYLVLRARKPQIAAAVGKSAEELEPVSGQAGAAA